MKSAPKPATVRLKKSTARAAGEVTRERMLDAAEECFATHGFHGTSMRDIARGASTPIALVSYHFKSKDNLFDRVIERRASYMGMRRMNALQEARSVAGDKPIALQTLIESYVWPFVERSTRGGPGWKNYSQLVARLANSPAWTPVISKHYDDVAREYIAEFRRSMKGAADARIYHAFSFMVGTMVGTVAEPGRVDSLSLGSHTTSDLEVVFKLMIPFLEAGFNMIHKDACAKRDLA
jgi:AcrR family transcriptional regulator